jgi:YgiT-type zinc finger domain-containing protein
MILEQGRDSRCPLCGGRIKAGPVTIPFVFPDTAVVVKEVPAESCASCHESFVTRPVTDCITELLNCLRVLHTEVSIVSHADTRIASAPWPPARP